MTTSTLGDLYRHMEWADARAWTAVAGSEAGRADDRLREVLYHTHLVQHAFLRTWRGEPTDAFPTFDTWSGLADWARTFHAEAARLLPTLTDGRLDQPTPLAWAAEMEREIGRPPTVTTLGETMLQVALHSVHHRAQVSLRLRELGAAPPQVDYIDWLWRGRPAAEWPARVDR